MTDIGTDEDDWDEDEIDKGFQYILTELVRLQKRIIELEKKVG